MKRPTIFRDPDAMIFFFLLLMVLLSQVVDIYWNKSRLGLILFSIVALVSVAWQVESYKKMSKAIREMRELKKARDRDIEELRKLGEELTRKLKALRESQLN